MKHPIHYVVAGSGGCLLLAGVSIGLGVWLDQPVLKSAAKWLWLSGIFIAFLPLLTLVVVLLIEKMRGK